MAQRDYKVQIKPAQDTLATSVCSAFPAGLVLDTPNACSESFPSVSTVYTLETGLRALLQCLSGQNVQISFLPLQLKLTLSESTAGKFQKFPISTTEGGRTRHP